MTKLIAKSIVLLAAAWFSSVAVAAGSTYPLDRFPVEKLTDQAALQNGAKLFVNYCLNCHGASAMRYNRLVDIGLTEDQIKRNLMFAGEKVGEPMKVALRAGDAKEWFGALPPDLSLIARSRASGDGSGPDWLYTYLRAYYRDSTRSTGWNNALFENVGMPHVLWPLQGQRGKTAEDVRESRDAKTGKVDGLVRTKVSFDADGLRTETTEKLSVGAAPVGKSTKFGKPEGGSTSAAEYDSQVADLVAFITYMSDPSAASRVKIGAWVLMFLALFTVFAWNLNRVYWKDVK
jgi:ubiquinol-cytochrome c reductase cytochrome c1 subunit